MPTQSEVQIMRTAVQDHEYWKKEFISIVKRELVTAGVDKESTPFNDLISNLTQRLTTTPPSRVTKAVADANTDAGRNVATSIANNGAYGIDGSRSSVERDYVASVRPRDGFRASHGYVLLAADYSQIELRLMAHLSADPCLRAAFSPKVATDTNCAEDAKAAGDVFRKLAAGWRGKPVSEVTDKDRNAAKQVRRSGGCVCQYVLRMMRYWLRVIHS
jgi:hypothetical protein